MLNYRDQNKDEYIPSLRIHGYCKIKTLSNSEEMHSGVVDWATLRNNWEDHLPTEIPYSMRYTHTSIKYFKNHSLKMWNVLVSEREGEVERYWGKEST